MPASLRQRTAAEEKLKHFAKLRDQGLEISIIRERMGIGKGAAYALKMKLDTLQENENGQVG